MRLRTILILAAVPAAAAGWYAFRPERLFIDARVNEAAETAPGAAVVARGSFHGVAHATRGTATAVRRADGSRYLRLADFATSNGPDVQLYLVAAPDASDDRTVTESGFVSLGALKGNLGDQNYEIPAAVDLGRFRAVTVWCRRFAVNFATAPLSAAGLAER
ncbi:MAG TPA: DM13 domain-containing protein [Frankiaceae bacterium]|nr:DM13 domain-containing protein [Frankiaceae bacterium]